VALAEPELVRLRSGDRGQVPEVVLEDGTSVEVKRVADHEGHPEPRRRGRRTSAWSRSPIIRAGLRKMTARFASTLRRKTGIEVRRHVFVVVIPDSMSVRHERRVRHHIERILGETEVEMRTTVMVVRIADEHF
jgi:hypothetical protein